MEHIPGNLKTFRGQTEHGLDGKGRLNVPARFRDVLAQTYEDDMRVIITPPWEKYLRVYPLMEWAELEVRLMRRAREDSSAGLVVDYLVGKAIDTKIDKNGRILLPPQHRTDAGIIKDVVLVGKVKHFTIWDKTKFDAEHVIKPQDFASVNDLAYF